MKQEFGLRRVEGIRFLLLNAFRVRNRWSEGAGRTRNHASFIRMSTRENERENLYARRKCTNITSSIEPGGAQTSSTRDRCVCGSLLVNYVRTKPQANLRTPCHT